MIYLLWYALLGSVAVTAMVLMPIGEPHLGIARRNFMSTSPTGRVFMLLFVELCLLAIWPILAFITLRTLACGFVASFRSRS